MKVIFIQILILFLLPGFGQANSGPTYLEGYPSSDIMVVDQESPIIVENEQLVFDFSSSNNDSYTVKGNVVATYEMVNPTNEQQSVNMVFPFVGSLNSYSPDDIEITSDNQVLPYEMYLGREFFSQENKKSVFDFEKIVSNINNQPYEAKHFNEHEKGKLYTIDIKPTTDQSINFVIDFKFDSEETKIFTSGFNGYHRENNKTQITAWINEAATLEIFVLGTDIDMQTSAYTDGELKEKTDSFSYETLTNEIEVKDYLLSLDNLLDRGELSDIQLYNLYARSLDQDFDRNLGYSSLYDLIEEEHHNRVISLVYTVQFPPNSSREVAVRYQAVGTMDQTETATPLFTFDYILNPAKHWSDFEDLSVKIITPNQAPYIVSSSIDLKKEDGNVYTASLSKLPEEDLSFTLFANQKVTIKDKIYGITFYAYLGLAILILLIGMSIYIRKKRAS